MTDEYDFSKGVRGKYAGQIARIATVSTSPDFDAPMEMIESNVIKQLRRENDIMRGILAKSDLPCVYCQLSKQDMPKCAMGFPGCGRMDDLMCDPTGLGKPGVLDNDPEAERLGLVRLGPGELTRYRKALNEIAKLWAADGMTGLNAALRIAREALGTEEPDATT